MTHLQAQEVEHIVRLTGKQVDQTIPITSNKETFAIDRAVSLMLGALDLHMGPMCGNEPRALSKNAVYIAKWRNIPSEDYKKMNGVVICEDWRDGTEAFIVLLK